MVGDAKLLLLPVRSLTSQFRWVTCPAALQRFSIDATRFCQRELLIAKDIAHLHDSNDNYPALVMEAEGDTLFLEEYRFKVQKTNLDNLIGELAALMHNTDEAKLNLQRQLAIVSNDMFSHISQHATPVNAHNAINSESKKVKNGALWYEETLPPEALLYCGIQTLKGRRPSGAGEGMSAKDVGERLRSLFIDHPWLQIGGNETVGMGWVSVKSKGA